MAGGGYVFNFSGDANITDYIGNNTYDINRDGNLIFNLYSFGNVLTVNDATTYVKIKFNNYKSSSSLKSNTVNIYDTASTVITDNSSYQAIYNIGRTNKDDWPTRVVITTSKYNNNYANKYSQSKINYHAGNNTTINSRSKRDKFSVDIDPDIGYPNANLFSFYGYNPSNLLYYKFSAHTNRPDEYHEGQGNVYHYTLDIKSAYLKSNDFGWIQPYIDHLQSYDDFSITVDGKYNSNITVNQPNVDNSDRKINRGLEILYTDTGKKISKTLGVIYMHNIHNDLIYDSNAHTFTVNNNSF